MGSAQTLEPTEAPATRSPFTHLVESGQSMRPGTRVRTWCAIYIRAGSPAEISRGERPTCPVCRQLQADLNDEKE